MSKVGEFFQKKTAGLPNWAWLGVIIVGVGVGYFIVKRKKSTIPTPTTNDVGQTLPTAPTADNVLASPSLQQSPPAPAFPSTQVGTQQIPVIPAGFTPIYSSNGDLVSFQAPTPGAPSPVASVTGTPSPTTPSAPAPQAQVSTPPATSTQPSAPPPAPATPATPPQPAQQTFTVKPWPAPGSSLSSIAGLVYGDPSLWPKIYAANRGQIGDNPDLIYPNQVLIIPPKTGQGGGKPRTRQTRGLLQ